MSDQHEAKCETFAEALSLLGTADLPDEERAAVLAHVAECKGCREQLEQVQAVVSKLSAEAPDWLDAAQDSVLESLAGKLGRPLNGRKVETQVLGHPAVESSIRQRTWRKRLGMGLAAGAVLAMVVWIAMNAWWGQGKVALPEGVDPNSLAETDFPGETLPPLAELSRQSEVPTWLEMQRSLVESDAAFERVLARGHTRGISQSIQMKELLEELMQ